MIVTSVHIISKRLDDNNSLKVDDLNENPLIIIGLIIIIIVSFIDILFCPFFWYVLNELMYEYKNQDRKTGYNWLVDRHESISYVELQNEDENL